MSGAQRSARSGAPSGGAGSSRPRDDSAARLIGVLPDAEAFELEFPGSDLVSTLLARSLERVGAVVESAVSTVWRRHGLSHAGGNALAVIEGAGRPMTPGEISAAMHITSGSITSLLDTLEGRGMVQRTLHAGDRRKILVSITDDGRTLLDNALPAIQQMVRRLLGGLSGSERSQLLELLRRTHEVMIAADLSDVPTGHRNPRGR